jgi:Ca2+-transporting ATPase
MYTDKKRSSVSTEEDIYRQSQHQPPQAISTSSYAPRRANARPTMAYVNTSNHHNNPYAPVARQPSPPATAYFSGFSNETQREQEPTPHADAQAHFAYSTTLRRHHVDSTGHAISTPISPSFFADRFNSLMTRTTRVWDGLTSNVREPLLEDGERERNASREARPAKEGKSGQFASWSAEVRSTSLLEPFHLKVNMLT